MKFYAVIITYLKPFAEIEPLVPEHRAHLQRGVNSGNLLLSGPQEPRTGGIIITRAANRAALDEFIAADPYRLHGVAEFRAIEFVPGRHQPFLASWLASAD